MGGIILKFVEIFIISRFPWKNINRKTGRSDGGIQFTYKSGYFIISPSAAFLAAIRGGYIVMKKEWMEPVVEVQEFAGRARCP